jgi:periplasmic divalent cation tolerance protein
MKFYLIMSSDRSYIFLVTVPNIEEGKNIGKILIENKLAACVNIIQNIYSIYKWKEKVVKMD